MPLYEHVFIARQDISNAQAEELINQFTEVLTENGGTVVGQEYWGVRPMAFKINKNRKGHYAFLRIDAPSSAVQEMERQQKLHDDVMRNVSFRVEEHDEGPTAIMVNKSSRDDRRRRDDRDDRGPRGDRPPRDDKPRAEAPAPAPAAKEE